MYHNQHDSIYSPQEMQDSHLSNCVLAHEEGDLKNVIKHEANR